MDPSWSLEILQSYYLDNSRKRVKPNVCLINPKDNVVYCETNSYGFKSPEINQDARQVAFWGDSVVFGIGMNWVGGAEQFFPGLQFLNGGLEGDPGENISGRAIEMNQKLELDFNIFFPGCHSFRFPKFESMLRSLVPRLPGLVLCTVPTSLTEKIVNADSVAIFYWRPA